MYLWKCWRDTRATFFVFLALILVMGAAGATIVNDVGGWTSRRAVPAAWHETGLLLFIAPSSFVYLSAFLLGAVTLGDEYSKGTLPFLLTRPRQRQSLVWGNWLWGALTLEFLVFLSLALYFASPAPPAYPRGGSGFFAWRLSLLMLLVPLLLYSLTFFLTMLFRSGRYGSGAALLMAVGYLALAMWLSLFFDIQLPYAPGPRARYWSHFPWGEMASWLLTSLALVWISRTIFVRREV